MAPSYNSFYCSPNLLLTIHIWYKAMPTLKDVMTRTVISVREADSLLDAQHLMVRNNIKRLVVIDDKNIPIGIITQKDMVRGLIKGSTGKPLDKITVKSITTKNPISLDSQESTKKATQMMNSKNVSSIIVVDKMGRTVGIITKSDICRYISTLGKSRFSVRQFMTKNPVTIGPNYSIFAAANVMSEMGFTRLIVIEDRKPIGIVTLSDLVSVGAVLTSPDKRLSVIIKGELIPSRILPIMMVRNIMTSDPFVINEDADIIDAAKIMAKLAISGLPVVNEKGILSGIITKTDLVKMASKIN